MLALVTGMTLAPGKRTVSAALRVIGLGQARDFARYHHVLSRARWNSAAIGRKLLLMILDRFLPTGPVVIGIDDTIERRWGRKIAARGIYRDPVRSSHGHFVKTSGLRWLSVMAMVSVPWTRRRWGSAFSHDPRPFRTLRRRARASPQEADRLGSPSHPSGSPMGARSAESSSSPTSSFSALDLIAAVRRHVSSCPRGCASTPISSRQRRRAAPDNSDDPPKRAVRFPSSPRRSKAKRRAGPNCRCPIGMAISDARSRSHPERRSRYHCGLPPAPIRWLLVRDSTGVRDPQAFLCTDLDAAPVAILGWFVHRWSIETTFQECRAHLGVESLPGGNGPISPSRE